MPAKASPSDPLVKLMEWQAKCPVKAWMRTHKVSVRDMAALLDVSIGTIQNWTSGNSLPDLDNAAKLARLTQDLDFHTTLLTWYNAKPQL